MDWPTVTLLLGILGTVTVSIIKFVPQRTVHETTSGQRCATQVDLDKSVAAICAVIKECSTGTNVAVHEVHSYIQQRNHDVLNALSPINNNLLILVERTRGVGRRSRDDEE